MIDQDLIESQPAETRMMIRESLRTLAASGVLEAQQNRLVARVAFGDESEGSETLMQTIRETRWKMRALQQLQELGNQFGKEDQDD
jgi:DNA-binding FadR family transcriptional regulator